MKRPAIWLLLMPVVFPCHAQEKPIDTSGFRDAAHHWYDIKDKSNIIQPRPGHPVYRATETEAIADNILLYQKTNGGWPKNYDMQAVLTPDQKDSLLGAKNDLHTTYDNGTTYVQIEWLAKAYSRIPKEAYRNAVLKGLAYVIASQYANGGFPQYYPLQNNYSRYITYNDDAYIGVMELLQDIVNDAPEYRFIDAATRARLITAYQKGIDCIVQTQINENGLLTAWCQQHDEQTLQPAWARKFEPPGICNGESAGIVLFLMHIKKPSPAVRNAIEKAVAWFESSKIRDTKVLVVDAPEMTTPFGVSRHDRLVVNSPGAAPIWTRYYELATHRPLFCDRNSRLVYSLAEVDRERRDGYSWYTYAPQKVLDNYARWKDLHP